MNDVPWDVVVCKSNDGMRPVGTDHVLFWQAVGQEHE